MLVNSIPKVKLEKAIVKRQMCLFCFISQLHVFILLSIDYLHDIAIPTIITLGIIILMVLSTKRIVEFVHQQYFFCTTLIFVSKFHFKFLTGCQMACQSETSNSVKCHLASADISSIVLEMSINNM